MSNSNTKKNEQQGKYKKQQQLKKKTAPLRAKKSNASKQDAKKSFASAPVGKSVNQCLLALPISPLVIAKKPENMSRTNCSLIRINAQCEHEYSKDSNLKGFRRPQSDVLDVIPTASRTAGKSFEVKPIGVFNDFVGKKGKGEDVAFNTSITQGDSSKGDELTLEAKMFENCGKHPLWSIKDGNNQINQGQGTKVSFSALPPTITEDQVWNLFDFWWLKEIEPRKYSVEWKDHSNVVQRTTHINVYPSIESSLTINFGDIHIDKGFGNKIIEFRKRLQWYFGVIEALTPNLVLKPKLLEGSASFKNSWSEDGESHRAMWEGEGSINFDPFIALDARVKIAPAFVPKFLSKYVDIYPYLTIKGEVTVKGAAKWNTQNQAEANFTICGAITVGAGLEANAGLDETKYISLNGEGGTKLSLWEGKFVLTAEPSIKSTGDVKWDPFIARFTLEVWDGKITYKKEWQFFSQKVYPIELRNLLSK